MGVPMPMSLTMVAIVRMGHLMRLRRYQGPNGRQLAYGYIITSQVSSGRPDFAAPARE